jgi:TRAP-type C4-dicarboxylate transport system substrate-binding protein
MRPLLLMMTIAVALPARAQTVLRVASVAPDGTSWGRELRTFARELERRTEGRVRTKLYMGGIAGGEQEVAERIRRGQLDVAASGGPLCVDTMPSMRVLQFPGLFQTAGESKYVINQLAATMAAEAERAGFVNLGTSPLGSAAYFSRRPLQSFADLRRQRIWVWNAEPLVISLLREMGLTVIPAAVERAARDYDAAQFDGFWALPTAALAFQWSVQATTLIHLHGEYLHACMLVASRVYSGLSKTDQGHLRTITAELSERLQDISRREEQALIGGAFQHQGVTVVEPGEKFRAEFFAAANAARDRIGTRVVPPELLQRVRVMLSDYRAEQAGRTP